MPALAPVLASVLAPPPADTLFLKATNGASLTETYQFATDDFTAPATVARAEALWQMGRFRRPVRGRPLNLGFVYRRVWLRLAVQNTLPQPQDFLWSLYNFADSATLYGPGPTGGAGRRLVGASSWAVAAARPFAARPLCLPFRLGAGQRAVLWLRVEHRSGGVYFPTDVTTPLDFLLWEATFPTDHYWIWLAGFYLSSGLLSLLLYGFLRDRLYLWYALYVAAAMLFLLMEDGLDSQTLPATLYRLLWTVGQYNWLLVAGACAVRIQQLFTRQRSHWPRLYTAGVWLAHAALAWVVVCGGIRGAAAAPVWQAWLPALAAGREGLLVACLAYNVGALALALTDRRQRRLAAYYAVTFGCFLLGSGQFWLNHMGLTTLHFLPPNTLAWGLLVELVLLSVLLTGHFRATLRQNTRLRIRHLRHRAVLGARLIRAQEDERVRLGQDLHDAVGPALTALHLTWQRRPLREALAGAGPAVRDISAQADVLLHQVRQEVRALSHLFAPPGLRQDLLTALSTLVAALDQPDGSGPRVVLRPIPDPAVRAALAALPVDIATAAHHIAAELLHNALRHAHAAHIELTLTCAATGLHLTVTDDGRGLPAAAGLLAATAAGPDAAGPGLGMRSMRTRAEYLGGAVAFAPASAGGTRAEVHLPLHPPLHPPRR